MEQSLAAFWDMEPPPREAALLNAIVAAHAWHYPRNAAYRHTVSARGVGPEIGAADLPRLLRPTAQTFKSYIDLLGSPFPQERGRPQAFGRWLADQLSLDLPRERLAALRPRYPSLEALLCDVERLLAEWGLEISTSSGTSGRASIVLRDGEAMDRTVESFYLAFQRYLGMRADHRAIFMMPRRTRIAMARMAYFSIQRVGLGEERVHFAIPFPAFPDHVRIRAGRTFRPGQAGAVERRVWHPAMNWLNDRYIGPDAVRRALGWLARAEAAGEKVLLFGSPTQLHAIAQELKRRGRRLRLAAGSLFGTGGGMKERYPFTPAQIRADVAERVGLADGRPIPMRDVYGMAEANWAAMQCREGNYHVPPWVYVVTLDDDGRFQEGADTTGMLAFYDPVGGGALFPAFFRTADQVRLIGGACAGDGRPDCPCGERGAFLMRDSIQRADLVDEAGCAAQV